MATYHKTAECGFVASGGQVSPDGYLDGETFRKLWAALTHLKLD